MFKKSQLEHRRVMTLPVLGKYKNILRRGSGNTYCWGGKKFKSQFDTKPYIPAKHTSIRGDKTRSNIV